MSLCTCEGLRAGQGAMALRADTDAHIRRLTERELAARLYSVDGNVF